ncbi:MAG: hypothetical protein IJG15_01210, partial [Lachnospiraceae bacterium]|nr:hypothetical protein [Lachnospiraceae bacterium]
MIILHICAAAAVVAGWTRGILHIPSVMLWMAVLLPLWGPACAVAAELHYRGGEKADEEPGTGRFGITDEVYRSIRMDEEDISSVLPIEDVLAFGTPVQRRSLLLSVLHTGAAPFVRPLRTAGVNDDTEVVHYAVTALVELRSAYNQRIADMEKKLQAAPSDTETLLTFADLDEEYLRSGIPENSERDMRAAHCRRMLEKALRNVDWEEKARGRKLSGTGSGQTGKAGAGRGIGTDFMRVSLLKRLGGICLDQGDAAAAEKAGRSLIKEEPDREEGYLMILDARVLRRDGKGISQIIKTIR